MSEMLTREQQLEMNLERMTGLVERQTEALELAREVLADWLVARTDEGKAKKRAAIKAIEGVQGE